MADEGMPWTIVFDRLRSFEEPRRGFYRDRGRNDVLTVGMGYTPIVDVGGQWALRPNVRKHFRAAGVTFTDKHMRALRTIEHEMNAGRHTSKEINAAVAELTEIDLDDNQQTALVRPMIEEARGYARAAVGADLFDGLHPVRQAELIVGAYQSPRAVKEAGSDLADAIRKDDWDAVARRWEAIGEELHDPGRYRAGAKKLHNPEGTGMTEVQPGDSLSSIARHHGTTADALLKANPHLTDPNRIRAGDVLDLPAVDGQPETDRGVPDRDETPGSLPGERSDRPSRGDALPSEDDRPAEVDQRSDAGEHPRSFRTEGARRVFCAVAGDGDEDAFDLLRKPPERLTEDEVHRIGRARIGLADGDPVRDNLFRHEEGFYRAIYGDGSPPRDETGRPLSPAPVRPVASRPEALRTADGTPLATARRRIAADLAADADRRDPAAAVRDLQERLNGLAARGRDGFGETPPLRLDGLFGTKTRRRLDDVLMSGHPVAGPAPGIVPAPSRRGAPAVV